MPFFICFINKFEGFNLFNSIDTSFSSILFMKERFSSSSIKFSLFSFHFAKILRELASLSYTWQENLQLLFAFMLKPLSIFIVIVYILYNVDAIFI
jgi:hypothetical protein